MHRAEEDYLKNIYKLTVEKQRDIVKNNELAETLGFTDQTVNEMVKRLTKKKFLSFLPYKGVSLTKKGVAEAKRLVRNHRLWEVFLVQKLNYSWGDVHEEAEKLEHASSDALIEHLYHFLGEPEYCVHGNPIPHLDDSVSKSYDLALSDLDEGEIFIIKRVLDQTQLLIHLDEIKIKLGTKLRVVEKNEFNGYLVVRILGEEQTISLLVASKLFGEIIK